MTSMFVIWLEVPLNPIKIVEYFHVLISNQFLGLHIFFYSVFMISNKGCIEKFSWTYLKNSLECTALEVRKYQTGFLGLLRMVWRVVFPLASWKISKNHVFSTRFMEKRIFPYNDLPFLALANLATQLEKWLFRVQLFVVPICNQMHLIFFLSPLLTAFS